METETKMTESNIYTAKVNVLQPQHPRRELEARDNLNQFRLLDQNKVFKQKTTENKLNF